MDEVLGSFLTFRLGDELFGTPVGKVLEILEVPRITKVPKSPHFMRGVINLRGNVLPVMDSRVKFGLPHAEDTQNTCIIVLAIKLDGQEISIGAVVDSVQEVLDIDGESIQPPPAMGGKFKSEFVEGMVKAEDQFIMLLDVDRVFTSNEVSILHDLSELPISVKN